MNQKCSAGLLLYLKGFLFSIHDLNNSLLTLREAVEDLAPDNRRLQRLVANSAPVSGYGMFSVNRADM